MVAAVRMFVDTGMTTYFRLPYLTLCRWLLSVRKNYRNVTYHNWDHAFNVTQTMCVGIPFSLTPFSRTFPMSISLSISLSLMLLQYYYHCHYLSSFFYY